MIELYYQDKSNRHLNELYSVQEKRGAQQPSSAAAPRVVFYSALESVMVNCASSNAASVMDNVQ